MARRLAPLFLVSLLGAPAAFGGPLPAAGVYQLLRNKPALPGGCQFRRVEYRASERGSGDAAYVEIAWGGMGESSSFRIDAPLTETRTSAGRTLFTEVPSIAGSGWGEKSIRKLFDVRFDAAGRIVYLEITYKSEQKGGLLGLGRKVWKAYQTKVCR